MPDRDASTDVERARLALDRERFEYEKSCVGLQDTFARRHFGALLIAVASILTVTVSAAQVWVAWITKERETALATMNDDRRWALEVAKFLAEHRAEIYGNDSDARRMIRNVMLASFPLPLVDHVFSVVAESVPKDHAGTWEEGMQIIDSFDPRSFSKAKLLARDTVYFDHQFTLYCGCRYDIQGFSGGEVDHSSCGYEARRNESRASRLEWEHVMPVSRLLRNRRCYMLGHQSCDRAGRRCCMKPGVDDLARKATVDLHNLAPVIGEVNGDRLAHPYGIVEGEERQYGRCDFEIGGSPIRAEPRPAVRGDVARIWLYMNQRHLRPLAAELEPTEVAELEAWSKADPVGDWELLRDRRIREIQGESNEFVAKVAR